MNTILIVDDEPDIRTSLKMILQLERFKVHTAEHCAAALEAMQGSAPDLVIADYMMPHMNGRELCRRLKSDPATQRTPIILMSAVDPGEPAYWNAYLLKPASADQLLETVRNLLPGR